MDAKEEEGEFAKIVYNNSYGGFSISKEALDLYNKKRRDAGLGAIEILYSRGCHSLRTDPMFISAIEELGLEKASGSCARLQIMEVPKAFKDYYQVDAYEGVEELYLDGGLILNDLLELVNVSQLSETKMRSLLTKLKSFVAFL